MTMLLAFALVGAAAQMVDGTLGMGFGVTSATLLTLLGYSAVAASAGTHAAKMGTTLVSGLSHWKAGNVDWRVLIALAVPGSVGAFIGAVVLTNIAMDTAKLWMAGVLFLLGLVIVARFGFGASLFPAMRTRARHLWPVGLVGGFVDATGGGGWGPVATPSMMILTKHEPHRVVGTVNAAEFVVAVSASAGLLFGMGESQIPWGPVLGLVVGGALVAPIAARLAHRAPREFLGVCVGGMVLISNTAIFARALGVPGAAAGALVAGIAAATLFIARRAHHSARRDGETPEADTQAADPVATTAS